MRRLFLCVVTAIVLVALATPAFAWTYTGKMNKKLQWVGEDGFVVWTGSPDDLPESGGVVTVTVMGTKDISFELIMKEALTTPGVETTYCEARAYEKVAICSFTVDGSGSLGIVSIGVRVVGGEGTQKFTMQVIGLQPW